MKRILSTTLLLAALALVTGAPSASADFGYSDFDVTYNEDGGTALAQAGTHRFSQTTAFEFNTVPNPKPELIPAVIPDEPVKHQVLSQIPGLIGNTTVVDTCTSLEFTEDTCPIASQVGWGEIHIGSSEEEPFAVPVYNLAPSLGLATRLGFRFVSAAILIDVAVSPEPPHNLIAANLYVPQTVNLYDTQITLWGVPADPAHDDLRGSCVIDGPGGPACAAGIPEAAWLTVPRACEGPLETRYEIVSWTSPEDWVTGGVLTHEEGGGEQGFSGCEALVFSPEATALPTTNRAESPSGLDFSIEIDDPGLTDPDGTAASDLRKAVVTLPEGLAVNPASAGGLDACSAAQLALETPTSAPGAGCPSASKLATVKVTTPLLTETLNGSVFLAEPYKNPLGTLLAGYLVIKQPERGIIVKLPGKIEADPITGQLTSSFDQNPQLPFSRLDVSFPPGPRASLVTPSICGKYEIETELHPWSGGPAVSETDSFAITQAPGGGSCPTSLGAMPNGPSFDAGVVSPIAASYTPFVVHLRRLDGSQRFAALDVTLPPGMTGKLAGTALCPEGALAQAAEKSGKEETQGPSCPAASGVGTAVATAGAGPTPYPASGVAYLAGPYKGAPLSVAVITPATAGPFDLGTIVVRTPLYINSRTAQITAITDPIPQILEGIPLDVRSIDVLLDRPEFTRTGTSCDPSSVNGSLTSALGQIAPLQSRFQLAECTRMGFKPKMTLSLKGGTKRGAHPALTVVLAPRPGDANIASLSLAMPRSEFLDQGHIRTVCTRVDFAADACPAAAVYGEATVTTPILDYPLSGHVYLRSSDNTLPDLVPDLRGPAHQPLKVESAGRTDSIRGGIRNTFDFVPDAPFSKLVTKLPGGRKGLLINSRDICQRPYRATVQYTAHNGRTYVDHPLLRVQCKKQGRKAKRSGR